jgi:hypothetical protein
MIDISPELGKKYQRFGAEKSNKLRERVGEFFPQPEKKDQQIRGMIDFMKTTLKLENRFSGHPNLELFYLTVAESIWDACTMLGLPIPSIGLLYEWHDKYATEHDNGLAAADVVGYRLKLSPRLIDTFLADKLFVYLEKYELTVIIFHEMYHFWQALVFPKQTQKLIYKRQEMHDINPEFAEELKQSGNKEYAAILFEKKATEHIQTKGVKEFFAKMITLLARRRQLKEFFQLRKEVAKKKAAFDEQNKL